MVKAKKENRRIKKPFLVAAVLHLALLFLLLLSSLFNMGKLFYLSQLISIFIFIGVILIFVGYYYLGEKYNNKLLMNVILVSFILYVASSLFFSYDFLGYEEKAMVLNETLSAKLANLEQLRLENVSQEVISSFESEIAQYLLSEILPLIILVIAFYLIFALCSTFFAIGLIRLKEVIHAKTIGILTILSVWLVPTIIGILIAIPLSIAAYILTIIMFFSESKKAKE